jgi:hypothetical protein
LLPETKVPNPRWLYATPASHSAFTAWRAVMRLTPKPLASSGSEGIGSPGCRVPEWI